MLCDIGIVLIDYKNGTRPAKCKGFCQDEGALYCKKTIDEYSDHTSEEECLVSKPYYHRKSCIIKNGHDICLVT